MRKRRPVVLAMVFLLVCSVVVLASQHLQPPSEPVGKGTPSSGQVGQASLRIIAQEHFGPWKVLCRRDLMTDKVSCFVQTESHGRGVFGPTTLHLVISSSDKDAAPALVLRIPIMNLQRGLYYRLDSQEPQAIACSTVSGDLCVLQGPVRTQWINTMAAATTLVVRVFDQYDKPYDFPFNVRDFGQAMRAFNTAVSTYIH